LALLTMSSRPRRWPPATTLVLLVRHGETATTGARLPGRAGGLALTERGRQQAEAVAGRLAGLGRVDAVHVSPLLRARQTAAPIARAHDLRPVVQAGLTDLDVGEWTGAELKTVRRTPEWETVQRWPSGFRFPAGESFTEMQARVTETVQRLRADHAGGVVVAVSHADPIKAVVADAVGTHLDHFQRIVISPCSVTAIAYGPGGPTVLTVNSTGDDLAGALGGNGSRQRKTS
jgi:probable phosphoglycerate mutase